MQTRSLKFPTFTGWILSAFFCLNPSWDTALSCSELPTDRGLPFFYYREKPNENFGDYISLKLMERILDGDVQVYKKTAKTAYDKKLLAIGSIISFAFNDNVIWGSGINGKLLDKSKYRFNSLDVRAVRGPLTRQFLSDHFQIECPEVFGDPALLIPYFFPEFKRKSYPIYDHLLIIHYADAHLFPKTSEGNIVYATDPWHHILEKILDSKFVISTSLHGVVVAEAYGIPARLLRVSEKEPLFKYQDYYLGTSRPHFRYAQSVEEALQMGGDPPFVCDLQKLWEAFPFEFWPHIEFKKIDF